MTSTPSKPTIPLGRSIIKTNSRWLCGTFGAGSHSARYKNLEREFKATVDELALCNGSPPLVKSWSVVNTTTTAQKVANCIRDEWKDAMINLTEAMRSDHFGLLNAVRTPMGCLGPLGFRPLVFALSGN